MFETKRQFVSVCVGVVLGTAWWLFISGVWYNQHISHHSHFYGYETLPGIGAMIAFIMLNLIELKRIVGSESSGSISFNRFIKFWFFFWIASFFISGGGALWIWIKFYWGTLTGVDIFLQVLLIMLTSMAYLICRSMIK